MTQYRVTKTEAAQFFGVSVQALTNWFVRGAPEGEKEGRRLMVDLSALARWRIGQAGSNELEIERTRLTKAQADKTELEVRVLDGSLIPAQTVEAVWGRMIASARARLLSLPSTSAGAILQAADAAEVEDLLKAKVYEALAELREYDVSDYLPGAVKRKADEE